MSGIENSIIKNKNMMFNKIKNSSYIKHIMTLMSGTMLAQIIMLILMPIITRLYTTKAFGEFSLYTTIVGIVSLIVSLKYESAIMLPRQNKNSIAIAQLSFLIMLIFVSIISLVMFTCKKVILELVPSLDIFYWLIPIGIIVTGLYYILAAFSSRQQYYKRLSISKVTQSSTTGLYQIGNIWINLFNNGLIYGKLLGDFLALSILWKENLNLNLFNLFKYKYTRLKYNAKKYINFPKYQSPQVFINSLSQGLPIILLSILYSVEVAGLYTLTIRVLQLPVSLVGGSTRQVFYQKASKLHVNNKSFFKLYKKTTYSMILLFIVPFIVILLIGPYLFSFIFGSEWENSGVIAQILIFWTFFSFINAPSTISYQILNLQKFLLIIEVISLIFRIVGIYVGLVLFNSYLLSILFFVIVSALTNAFIITFIFNKIRALK